VPGSSGVDTVNVAFTAAGTYVLSLNVENAFVSSAVTGVNLTGNASDNTLTGNALNNLLNGAAGNDTLTGAGGNDVIDGGIGSDQVNMSGAYADYIVTRPNATDTVLAHVSSGERVTLRNVELVQFADGTLSMGGIWGNTPSAFNDMIEGTPGDDSINGLAGNDTLSGLAGNDALIGGLGIDSLVGGMGNDTYVVNVAGDAAVELADEGTDLINVAFTAAGTYALGAHVENAIVTAGATLAVHLVGNALDNTLLGNSGANQLKGGAGNDMLGGGLGADVLTGGTGQDVFRFSATLSRNVDKIADFNAADDTIELDNSIFGALGEGALSGSEFQSSAGSAAGSGAVRIILNTGTGALLYDADGAGGVAAVQFATIVLTGLAGPVTAADFTVT